MEDNIKVSIICNTYNHEKYIAETLESFLMQKTNFQYEILIHDDASTDKTAEIIRKYEEKYPNIIKPIYQTENQYSKKVKIGITYQFPRVKGKYIAICEGDDYWTDMNKLQKQYDAMEKNPSVDICAHSSNKMNANTNKTEGEIRPSSEDCILSIEQVIEGGGGYVATNSLFYRSEINKNMPEFRKNIGLDYSIQMHGSMRGGMLFLKDNMSVYRVGVANSAMTKQSNNAQLIVKNSERVLCLLDMVNKETDGKYIKAIENHRRFIEFDILMAQEEYKQIFNGKYRNALKRMPLKRRVVLRIKAHFPFVEKVYRKVRKK
ncbi:MAG: glycosyltransferase family 2 protein [Clostridia bacterium]|nr:glycosyltransferase family 2 protein [Clostridia bacterium]